MDEKESGIVTMRRRMERGQRRPPAAKREAPQTELQGAGESPGAPQREARTTLSLGDGAGALTLAPDDPVANLAIRVRRPLDERLADLVHDLRRHGVRTSKVELIEMLLWELAPTDAPALTARVAAFRRRAPRGSGAPLGELS